MTNTVSYNLSEIPGFNDLLNSGIIINLNVLKLNKITSRTNNSTYKVIRYDKNFLCADIVPCYGLCRSVIVNSQNKVVGFAPPKSISADLFIKNHPDISTVEAQEFVEGTMINVFFDPSIGVTGSWEISTRNTVGATSTFYKTSNSKTFREMFMDAASRCNLNVENLDKDICWSFVLQHPTNRIVVPFDRPKLYLVGTYKINCDNDKVIIEVLNAQNYASFLKDQLSTSVEFPQIYKFDNYSDLIEQYASMNTSYNIVGVVIHDKLTGERTKIRNPVYEQVRMLRGNQPKLQYQYLCLRKDGKVRDFLKFYPENKKDFSSFRDQVHLFTETLYSNYVSCYIKKEKPLREFSEQYRTHMYNIHQLYMNELREKKQFINSTIVQKYVNELHPSLLMYCLNFQMRKRNVDNIIANDAE
jgi:hypothetical protein